MQNNSSSFFLCGDMLFFKPVLRQHEAKLNEGAHIINVSGSLSVRWAATYTVSSLLLIPPMRHQTLSHLCKKVVGVFLRIRLGLALLSQQTEAEKDLPLGGAVVILHFKCLPSTLETANLTSPFQQTRFSQTARSCLLQHTERSLNKHRELILFYKTEVRLLDIKIVCQLRPSLGQSKVSYEAALSEASTGK